MSDNTRNILILLFAYFWTALVLGVTVYAVLVHDRSMWWFLLAFVILACGTPELKVTRSKL